MQNLFSLDTKISGYDSEPDPVGSVTNWPPGTGSGSVIQNYGSVDPVPEEIVKDPQHWILAKVSKKRVSVLESRNITLAAIV